MVQDIDDLSLLRGWQQGDRQAGDVLFRRHFQTVYRFFRKRSPEQSGELVQRTFLACVESRAKLDPQTDFVRYLCGIARNILLMDLRGRRVDDLLSLRALGSGQMRAAPELAPSTRAAQVQEDNIVSRALGGLPPDDQLIVQLYYREEWSVAEIAEVLCVSRAATKFRLFRARQRFAKEYGRVTSATGRIASQTTRRERDA